MSAPPTSRWEGVLVTRLATYCHTLGIGGGPARRLLQYDMVSLRRHVILAVVELRKESRRLENEIDLKLVSFSKLGSSYSHKDSRYMIVPMEVCELPWIRERLSS